MNENWQRFFDIGDSFNKQTLLKQFHKKLDRLVEY